MRTEKINGLWGVILSILLVFSTGCAMSHAAENSKLSAPAPAEQERAPRYDHAGWIIARASIHNHTTYSDGYYPPADLLELADRQGMAILAYTDHREGKMCLGRSRLLCLNNGGVENVGYEFYFAELNKMQKQGRARGMIVLKGVEVAPWLFNHGWFPSLVIRESYNHFTVYAIEDPKILEQMPVRNYLEVKPEADPGRAPFQAFVDYIVGHGGIVHAAHVEDFSDGWDGPVHSVTAAPIMNLMLKNLTGFAILPDGWSDKVGGAGGLWDTVLAEFMMGMRDKPLWTHGDADFHGPEGSLATATTLFYMKEFSEAEVYRCLRTGRMVALQGIEFQDSFVSEWWVSESGEPENPVMLGEEVRLQGTPTIRFALDHPVAGTRTRLIRNGRVIHEVEGVELTYVDQEIGSSREPCFYRIEVVGPHKPGGRDYRMITMPESEIFVNPIFVRFEP